MRVRVKLSLFRGDVPPPRDEIDVAAEVAKASAEEKQASKTESVTTGSPLDQTIKEPVSG